MWGLFGMVWCWGLYEGGVRYGVMFVVLWWRWGVGVNVFLCSVIEQFAAFADICSLK